MTTLDDLVRGDTRTLTISGLTDSAGDPATFGGTDVIVFTAKRHAGLADADALITKTSADSGITIDGGTATVTILPADFVGLEGPFDVFYVWDVQVQIGGDPLQVVTLDSGTGKIVQDVTVTVEEGA